MVVAFYIIFLLIFGSLNTLTTKWQFTETSIDLFGRTKAFEKPWWGNFAMFVAMAFVLIMYYGQVFLQKRREKRGGPDRHYRQLEPETRSISEFKSFLYVGIPAVLDLFGSGFTIVGLVYMNASVWQMLRGSCIVFSAFLSIPILQRKLHPFHLVGITLCVLGIGCVGFACVMGHPTDSTAQAHGATGDKVLGCFFVLFGQAVQAAQTVAEEKLLKDIMLPGMQIVGFEGLWGMVLMIFVLFPIFQWIPGNDCGSYENSFDTLVMIKNNVQLQLLIVLYLFSCSTYNLARMFVTNALSAVHFTMIDASRTCLIWLFNLALFYHGTPAMKPFGEALTPWSPVQALGFVVLLCGQCVYGGLVILPFSFCYPAKYHEARSEALSNFYASPACLRSSVPGIPYSPQAHCCSPGGSPPSVSWLRSPKKQEYTIDATPFVREVAHAS